jgi:hypothetical protein
MPFRVSRGGAPCAATCPGHASACLPPTAGTALVVAQQQIMAPSLRLAWSRHPARRPAPHPAAALPAAAAAGAAGAFEKVPGQGILPGQGAFPAERVVCSGAPARALSHWIPWIPMIDAAACNDDTTAVRFRTGRRARLGKAAWGYGEDCELAGGLARGSGGGMHGRIGEPPVRGAVPRRALFLAHQHHEPPPRLRPQPLQRSRLATMRSPPARLATSTPGHLHAPGAPGTGVCWDPREDLCRAQGSGAVAGPPAQHLLLRGAGELLNHAGQVPQHHAGAGAAGGGAAGHGGGQMLQRSLLPPCPPALPVACNRPGRALHAASARCWGGGVCPLCRMRVLVPRRRRA